MGLLDILKGTLIGGSPMGNAVGGAAAGANAMFGNGNANVRAYDLGGGQKAYLDYDLKDKDEAMLHMQMQGLGKYYGLQDKLMRQAMDGAARVQTDYSRFNPSLNTNFNQFATNLNTNFAPQQGGFDAYSQGLLARGQQDINNQLATQQSQIQRRLGANNPAAAVVSQQASMRAGLSSNPLLFQVGEQQRNRQMQEQQLSNQALLTQQQEKARLSGLSNEAQLAQNSFGANLQNMGNASLAQRLQMQAMPLASQQNLMSMLQSLQKS